MAALSLRRCVVFLARLGCAVEDEPLRRKVVATGLWPVPWHRLEKTAHRAVATATFQATPSAIDFARSVD